MSRRQHHRGKKRPRSWHRGKSEHARWQRFGQQLPELGTGADPTTAEPVRLRRKGRPDRGDTA
jgi:hypothetical protein